MTSFSDKGAEAAALLAAISCGSVFMGANTYIGNGPNFMVKAIAEENGVKMPSFFGYMAYSGTDLDSDFRRRDVCFLSLAQACVQPLGDLLVLSPLDRVLDKVIVAVIRAENSDLLVDVAEALVAGGVEVMEVTFTVPRATQVLEKVAAKLGNQILLGAGTVLDCETARVAILSGGGIHRVAGGEHASD